ncbi:hypothetical protein QWY77_03515 [Thalassotalea ponticola]|uniref:hypothetical protein n=1 Tax=Thalassotalea ponticola TaxID=1523392 RepID=UPI0025B44076|nr:hypothetical protein [Thalassotalea ponticola]MDN3651834.1 hypothetical protein [Thalassotalea ponticola]
MTTKLIKVWLFSLLTFVAVQNAYADNHEPPFIGGHYWEVTGIKLADGAGLKYAKWLATEWRKNLEFAKKQGWIESYHILSNTHPRSDEPDLYLVRIFSQQASVEEGENRRKTYMAWAKKSMEQMQSESGNRAEYRTVMSTVQLQEMLFRK